jgi:hypothetical protein
LDDEDKTEHGWLLVTTTAGWKTEMAKWIGDARAADDDDSKDDSDILAPATSPYEFQWKKTKLEVLFGGLPKRSERIQTSVDQEMELMEALANEEEDAIPDNGAIDHLDDDFKA